jgi:hypothetical protein
MGRITSLFARKVAGQVEPRDGVHGLLDIVGLDEEVEPDPSLMIPDEDYYLFFETAAGRDRDLQAPGVSADGNASTPAGSSPGPRLAYPGSFVSWAKR